MIYLAIDPSVNNVGIALYESGRNLLQTKVIHPPRSTGEKDKVQIVKFIIQQLIHFLNDRNIKIIDVLILEYPNWQASERGLIAMQQGYTLDLAFVVGCLYQRISSIVSQTLLPTPRDWKGNLPKTATKHRVQKEFGELQISEHEYDAIGMIQWARKQYGTDTK